MFRDIIRGPDKGNQGLWRRRLQVTDGLKQGRKVKLQELKKESENRTKYKDRYRTEQRTWHKTDHFIIMYNCNVNIKRAKLTTLRAREKIIHEYFHVSYAFHQTNFRNLEATQFTLHLLLRKQDFQRWRYKPSFSTLLRTHFKHKLL